MTDTNSREEFLGYILLIYMGNSRIKSSKPDHQEAKYHPLLSRVAHKEMGPEAYTAGPSLKTD
jgi:hypothetical protein